MAEHYGCMVIPARVPKLEGEEAKELIPLQKGKNKIKLSALVGPRQNE